MEIIVKKNILDELQAKGLCQSQEEADKFLHTVLEGIATSLSAKENVTLDKFGTFICQAQAENTNAKVIPSDDTLNKFLNIVSMDKGKVQKALAMLVHFFKEMLLKGHEVQLFGFASFRIENKKFRVLKTPVKGQSSLIPPRKVLVFEPDRKIRDAAGKQQIQFEPAEDLKKQIARLQTANILLCITKYDFFIKTLEYYFTKAGWKVNIAQNIEDAKHFVNSSRPHLVVLEQQVPNSQSLCEMIKCTLAPPSIPFLTIYPQGIDLKKPTEIRICSDEYLVQPFEIKQLISATELLVKKGLEEETGFKHEVMFQFLTIDDHIEKVQGFCSKLLDKSGLTGESLVSVGTAFREALSNAVQHGNKHRRDKMLEVLYWLDKEKIILAVTDSGPGFDWQKYVRPGKAEEAGAKGSQKHQEGKAGGMGIMLMLRCVDKLEYNEIGNMVTLTKYLK